MPNVDNTTTYWAEFQKAIAAVKDHPVRFVSLLPSFFPSSFLVSFCVLSFFPSFAQGRSCATCFFFPCSFLVLSFVQDRNCATLLCTSAHSRVPIHSHVITRCALNILRGGRRVDNVRSSGYNIISGDTWLLHLRCKSSTQASSRSVSCL